MPTKVQPRGPTHIYLEAIHIRGIETLATRGQLKSGTCGIRQLRVGHTFYTFAIEAIR
jgi:hypothetical protein